MIQSQIKVEKMIRKSRYGVIAQDDSDEDVNEALVAGATPNTRRRVIH